MVHGKFEGFPAGELRFTSVPDLFFAELLPAIDDLAELKVTLHVIWLRQRAGRQVVTQAELSLLHALVETEEGAQDVYLLNSEGGRQALARIQSGELGTVGAVVLDRPSVEPRPNIFELYEDNIGLLSPMLAEELRDAEATYPSSWIEDAFRIAVTKNMLKAMQP